MKEHSAGPELEVCLYGVTQISQTYEKMETNINHKGRHLAAKSLQTQNSH